MLHFYKNLCIFSNYYLNIAIYFFFLCTDKCPFSFLLVCLCLLSLLRNCLSFELARDPKLAQLKFFLLWPPWDYESIRYMLPLLAHTPSKVFVCVCVCWECQSKYSTPQLHSWPFSLSFSIFVSIVCVVWVNGGWRIAYETSGRCCVFCSIILCLI